MLRAHGYRTGAFIGSVLLGSHLGLDQGFDFYDSPFRVSAGAGNPAAAGVRRDGALVVRAARQWLIQNHGRPVFAFLHFFDLHAPYARAESRNGLPNPAGYDAEIEYVDRLIGEFQRALVAGDWWDRSLVVLLSDHGESLGEHGETSHGYFIYQAFRRLLAGDPHNSMARYYLGDAYLRSGNTPGALREWESDLRLDPEYAPAAEALGAWWMGRASCARARLYFQKALAAQPRDYAALLGEGMAEERLGLLREAHDHLGAACRALASSQCSHELAAVEARMKQR